MTSYRVPDKGFGFRDTSLAFLLQKPHSHRVRAANTWATGSPPTAFVAGANSNPSSIAAADQSPSGFVASGTADEVEFAAALAMAGPNGRLLVAEGTYNFTDEVIGPSGIWIDGMGYKATRFNSTAGTGKYVFKSTSGSAMVLSNLAIQHTGGGGVFADAGGGRQHSAFLLDVLFANVDEHCIVITGGGDVRIIRCLFNFNHAALANTFDDILVDGINDHTHIRMCQWDGPTFGDTRYAINLSAATVTKAHLQGNELGNVAAYGTAAINDAGTDTVYEQAKELPFFSGGTLTVGSGTFKLPTSQDVWIIDAQPTVDVSPVGSDLVFDVNLNGTSIYPTSTKPTVTDGDADGVGPLAPPDTHFAAKGSRIQIDIDAVGSTTPGTDAQLKLRYIYV